MGNAGALLLSLVIAIILMVLAAWVWHRRGAWVPFSFSTGQVASFARDRHGPLAFRKCYFTVVKGGVTTSWNVSGVLDVVAKQSQPAPADLGALKGHDSTLYLNGVRCAQAAPAPCGELQQLGMNPFSFIKAGYNDPASVTDRAAWAAGATVILSGEYWALPGPGPS